MAFSLPIGSLQNLWQKNKLIVGVVGCPVLTETRDGICQYSEPHKKFPEVGLRSQSGVSIGTLKNSPHCLIVPSRFFTVGSIAIGSKRSRSRSRPPPSCRGKSGCSSTSPRGTGGSAPLYRSQISPGFRCKKTLPKSQLNAGSSNKRVNPRKFQGWKLGFSTHSFDRRELSELLEANHFLKQDSGPNFE
jgi:hypothetical protein